MRRLYLVELNKPPRRGEVYPVGEFWAKRLASSKVSKVEYPISVKVADRWYVGSGLVFKRENTYFCEILDVQSCEYMEKSVILLGLLKDFYMDLAVRSAAELLVDRIVLFKSDHSASYVGSARLDRLNKVALEHSATVGRPVPLVLEPISDISNFDDSRFSSKLLLSIKTAVARFYDFSIALPACVAIGPEGDFTEKEEKILISKGFVPVTLGENILSSWACVGLVSAKLFELR